MEKIHNRMAVILKPKDFDRWLEPGDPQRPPVDLLRPYPAELMKSWKVGKDVGNVRNDNPGLCVESLVGKDEPAPKVEPKKEESKQGGLFD